MEQPRRRRQDSRTVRPNGPRIKELREKKFGSREAFLKALGGEDSDVSLRRLGSIERGTAMVFPTTLHAIARTLGVPYESLLAAPSDPPTNLSPPTVGCLFQLPALPPDIVGREDEVRENVDCLLQDRGRVAGLTPVPESITPLKLGATLRPLDESTSFLVCDFLERLARAGLATQVRFRPDHWPIDRLFDFLMPARIVDEAEYESALARAWREGRDPPGSMLDRDYLAESVLRGEARVSVHELDAVWSRKGHVVLRGEPGEGKTTALWRLVSRQCRQIATLIRAGTNRPDDPRVRVPLALPLNEVGSVDGSSSLVERAAQYCIALVYGLNPPTSVVQWVAEKVKRGEFELYLDALDELADLDAAAPADRGSKSRQEWLLGELVMLANTPVVLSSRLTAEPRDLLTLPTRYRMVPLESGQVREYVDRYFDPRFTPDGVAVAEALHHRFSLSPGPRQLVRIPLLLALLCDLRRRNPSVELPCTRTALLRLGLMGLLERGDARRRPGRTKRDERNIAKIQVLNEVAWQFHSKRPRPMGRLDLLGLLKTHRMLIEEDMPASANALLNEFLTDGILVPRGVDGRTLEERYWFILRSFHEFCLAGWIAHRAPFHRDRAEFTRVILGGPQEWCRTDWPPKFKPMRSWFRQNIWSFVGGQLGSRAGWLLAAIREDYRAASVAAECQDTLPEWQALYRRLVRRMDNMRSVNVKRPKERWAEALVRMGARGVATLIDRLKNSATPENIRHVCAWALGRNGGPSVEAALTASLDDPFTDAELRAQCASSLATLMGSDAAPALIARLADPSIPDVVRATCAETLGGLGGEDVVSALLSLFDNQLTNIDPESYMWALVHIGGPNVVTAIIERLDNPSTPYDSLLDCVWVLNSIDSPSTQKVLHDRFYDSKTSEEVLDAIEEVLEWSREEKD